MKRALWAGLVLVFPVGACGESTREEHGNRPSAGAPSGSAGIGGNGGTSGSSAGRASGASGDGVGGASGAGGASLGGAGSGGGGLGGASNGGAGTGGAGGAPGGAPFAGAGSGGASAGTSGASGDAGASAGSAGAGGGCSAPIDAEYCAVITGQCPSDTGTSEQCEAVAAAQRCGYASDCIPELDAVEECGAAGTPICVDGYTYASGIDCIDESAAFYGCVDWQWSCSNETTRCYCTHIRPEEPAGDPGCTNLFDCCFTNLFGVSCECYEQAVCDTVSDPLRPPVPSCPLP